MNGQLGQGHMFKEVRRSGRVLRGGLYTKAVGKTTGICATGASSQTGA